MRKKYFLILFFLLIIIFVGLPIIQAVLVIGNEWQGVPPPREWDELYYYARIREVFDGNIFIGNPYFLEHKSGMAPAFFVADWLSALPMIFSRSVVFTTIFNFLFWSSITLFLLYKIFRFFKISEKYSLIISFLSCLQVYWLLLRPVTMQVVFPFMVLFWLVFLIWWEGPFKKRNIIFLSLAASFNFYIYSYSWQIVLITFFLSFVFLVLSKQRERFISLIKVNFLTILLSLPVIVYLLKQIHSPYYWETMYRIGLVNTHFPSYPVYSYGRWVVAFLILYFLTLVWLNKDNKKIILSSSAFIFFVLTGFALIFASISNIFTGKDLEIADHIARFIILWFGLGLFYYLANFVPEIRKILKLPIWKIMVILFLAVICLVGITRNIPRALPFSKLDTQTAVNVQAYAKPLNWLEKNESESGVIWANSLISLYVPILTKHYVLFSEGGGLHFVSSKEIEERYLVSHYFDNLTKNDIKKNLRAFAGAGNAKDVIENHNYKVKICHLLRLSYFGYFCGEEIDAVSYMGENYFDDLFSLYKDEIRPNINKELKKFQVDYIIKDKEKDSNFRPDLISNTNLVYQDERFLIYKININSR